MRPLIIDSEVKHKLAELKKFAEEHVYTEARLRKMEGDGQESTDLPGNLPEHRVVLPFGYKVVFTVEDHGDQVIRHLSMSVDTKGKMPNPHAVQLIMNELGFENAMENCKLEMEEFKKGHTAINVAEILELRTEK